MNRYIAFLKVFERNSFSDAARDLGYTQSAVSQMIKSLEEELGVTLLVRSRSGVALTYEGRHLLPYIRDTVKLFDGIRSRIGYDMALVHDVHERIAPIEAVQLAKQLEPFDLFFLEDAVPLEQVDCLRMLRQQSSIPLAQGELFNNPREWKQIIAEHLIDFIRVHISQIGGITPARKLAIFAEQFGVRTAWHGPGDMSPLAHAANIHIDLAAPNFGVQEYMGYSEQMLEVFPHNWTFDNGYMHPGDKPGLGIEFDEKLAAKYPYDPAYLPVARLEDGTLWNW